MTTTHTASSKPLSVEEVRKRRRPLRNVNKEIAEKIGRLDKLAVWITDRVGTMAFFLAIFVWTVLWLGWNLLAPQKLQFDPPMAFVYAVAHPGDPPAVDGCAWHGAYVAFTERSDGAGGTRRGQGRTAAQVHRAIWPNTSSSAFY